MAFCMNCGQELPDGAKFCSNCGTALGEMGVEESKRKTIYDGEIHKCPNCGETLDSFAANCPVCGYEIRAVKSVNSVSELVTQLDGIEARVFPHFDENESIIKSIFGRDFRNEDKEKEELENYEKQKRKQMAALIINYPVPNSKEDILEFMILASSNIHPKLGTQDVLTKAWITKLEQIYQRAEIIMSNHPDYKRIETIYINKKAEINKKRKTTFILIGAGVVAWFALYGSIFFI